MKKKMIIPIAVVLVLLIGVICFLTLNNNKITSTITLDINPSIEINLNNIEGKKITDVFDILITNLIDKGYVNDDNNIEVILHVEGKNTNKLVSEQIEFEFGKKDVHAEIITIEKVTKEDEELAKKYNVSPAKISYIKSIIEDNENINIENLVNDSVSELEKTKKTGKYCDDGYILEGDWCLKEKERIPASNGEVCPRGYAEYKGKCYEETAAIETNNYICNDEFKLVDNKCISEGTYDATGICEKGEYKDGYCKIKEYYGDAKEYCRITPSTDLLYNGRCLGRKPTINGKCLGSDKLIGGYCYDTSPSSGYKADWVCPDGNFITNPDGSLMYEDKKCYHESQTNPTSYYCEGEGVLDGKKCKTKTVENAIKEIKCPNGYIAIDDGSRCLNLNNTKNKENGLVCNQDNARLRGNDCIVYEMVEAKQY